MDWQERLEQYRIYQAKLQLVGLFIDAKGLFRINTGLDTISVNILKLAELNKYPEVLYIPNFVNELSTISEEERYRRSDDTERIKKLRAENKMPLSEDELQEIYARDEYDRASDEIKKLQELLKLTFKMDTIIALHLAIYLRETEGIYIDMNHEVRDAAYLYLRFLFNYDPEKLREYIAAEKHRKSDREDTLGLLSES